MRMKKNQKTQMLTAQKPSMVRERIGGLSNSVFLFCAQFEQFSFHLCSVSSTEKTRDELRVQVYDAMAEKKEEDKGKKNGDTEEEQQSEGKEKNGDIKAEAGDQQQKEGKKEGEEGKKETDESKSAESEEKTEKDEKAEKEPEEEKADGE